MALCTLPIVGFAMQADAKDFLVQGKCELIVASRKSISESQDYISENLTPTPQYTRIFLSQNGWYAISIGSLWPHEEKYIQEWKKEGKIPQDSLCSSGAKYVQAYDWDTGYVWQKPSTESVVATTTRPKACRNVRSFCYELAAKSAVCGWGAQAITDKALNTDTGALGSAATGAACTAVLSEAEGLDVDIVDLGIASLSSIMLDSAEKRAANNDIGGAIIDFLIGSGTAAIGAAKCEATLQAACR